MDHVTMNLGELLSYSAALIAVGFGIGHCITHIIYVRQFERDLRRIRINRGQND